MKTLTRTIIVLVVLNLAMGNLALAQNTRDQRIAESSTEPTVLEPTSQEPTDRRRRTAPAPPEPASPIPTTPAPAHPESASSMPTTPAPVRPEPATVAPTPPAPPAPSPYPMQAKSTGLISGRKVLVIPDTDVKPEELDAITQDLLVMSHILDERFKGSRTIKGVFTDFGDFFGRDNRSTEAIYIQGYGVVFLMEVNFAFSPPLKPEEQKDEETAEQVDPTWQRARQQIFSPKSPMPGMPDFSGQGPGLVEFDQLKRELIETLKHAANIRNLSPSEWIIVTVIGQGRQSGTTYEYELWKDQMFETSGPRQPSSSKEGGMMGGMGGYGGGMGGYGGGMGGYGGGMGGYGGRMGGMAGMGRMGGMAGMGMGMGGMYGGYGGMGFPSSTILTIRAKKTDVDEFARDELDFEEFQQTVAIFTY